MSFNIIQPSENLAPILLSIPHCGTFFPEEIRNDYKSELIGTPDDTDWFVDKLYGFATGMGITIIHAVNSRWVIDLNRAPDNTPLYSDGRIITGLCPTTDFLGQRIYKDERSGVEQTEIDRRIDRYFQPYHRRLAQLLEDLRSKFEQVLLWDCHSIRHTVPTIRKERFPDFILGDADGTSASPGLIETALAALEQSDFEVSHNYPFKGGHITRNFGKPVNGIHALQLEMNKINYMDDPETRYDEKRAEKIRVVLKRTFDKLIERLL